MDLDRDLLEDWPAVCSLSGLGTGWDRWSLGAWTSKAGDDDSTELRHPGALLLPSGCKDSTDCCLSLRMEAVITNVSRQGIFKLPSSSWQEEMDTLNALSRLATRYHRLLMDLGKWHLHWLLALGEVQRAFYIIYTKFYKKIYVWFSKWYIRQKVSFHMDLVWKWSERTLAQMLPGVTSFTLTLPSCSPCHSTACPLSAKLVTLGLLQGSSQNSIFI